MKLVYPACFYPEENGQYSVIFPDFGNATYGNSLDDALEMAADYLGSCYVDALQHGETLHEPSDISTVVADEYPNGFVTLVHVDGDAYLKKHPIKKPKKIKLEKVTKFNDWVYLHLAWVNVALLVLLVLSWALPAFNWIPNFSLMAVDKNPSIFHMLARLSSLGVWGSFVAISAIIFCLGALSIIATFLLLWFKKPSLCPLLSLPIVIAVLYVISIWVNYALETTPHSGFYFALLMLPILAYELFLFGTRIGKPSEPTTEKTPPQD